MSYSLLTYTWRAGACGRRNFMLVQRELSALTFNVSAINPQCHVPNFQYSLALVRDIDQSLPQQALRKDAESSVSLNEAHQQHETMCKKLKELIPRVVSLPSDGYPDSVFIEDTAVIAGGRALITRPGAQSRRGEVDRVKEYLTQHTSLHVTVQDSGSLDGGDVLFTGREFYVGLSKRTNKEGAAQLAAVFPSYRVTCIDMSAHETLHLKSACSMLAADIIIVGGKFGKYIQSCIADNIYNVVYVPEEAAANVVTINNNVLRRHGSEFPSCEAAFASITNKHKGLIYHPMLGSELAKVDGALTCCSLLI